jgi:hypothetical protein
VPILPRYVVGAIRVGGHRGACARSGRVGLIVFPDVVGDVGMFPDVVGDFERARGSGARVSFVFALFWGSF